MGLYACLSSMGIRDFASVLWTYRTLFAGTVMMFVVTGFLVWTLQPVGFLSEITMNVARTGVHATSDYAYDDFYRLQADERFADTVVRWLESPRIVNDIAKESNISREDIFFDADRLSSQVIRVRYVAREESEAKEIAKALFLVLNQETTSLNRDRSRAGWFALVGETPSITDARFGKVRALSVSVFLGMFFGFLAVMFRWYWMKKDTHENRD